MVPNPSSPSPRKPSDLEQLVANTELLDLHQVASHTSRGPLLDQPDRAFSISNSSRYRWVLNKEGRAFDVFTRIEALGADGNDEALRVEAEYRASYAVKGGVEFNPSEALMDAYASQIAAAHAWSFWREFLAQAASRMSAPPITAPLFHFSLRKANASPQPKAPRKRK